MRGQRRSFVGDAEQWRDAWMDPFLAHVSHGPERGCMSDAFHKHWRRMRKLSSRVARFVQGTLTGQHLGARHVVFIVGCQRSGTSMMLNILSRARSIWTFGENHPVIAHRYRLRSHGWLRMVTRAVPARHVVYKPLCDSQWTDKLLAEHPSARALWMYRRPDDVARSAQVKWADHQRDVLRRIHVRDWTALRWRGERLSDAARAPSCNGQEERCCRRASAR